MRKLLDTVFDELFPILRSITGSGYEKSLDILGRHMPITRLNIPSGTKVFDWVVPKVWECSQATLCAPNGAVVADVGNSSLHVVNYSTPVDIEIDLDELQPHLHSIPHLREAIPYVISYYKRNWGFCISHDTRCALAPGKYRAKIDSSFHDGNMVLAEAVLPGESREEILLSSYLCHPSLANNELSGPLVLLGLYKKVAQWKKRRYTYRFVINPETIGALCYLHLRGEDLRQRLVCGLVLTCLGGPVEKLRYQLSRRGDAPADKLARMWAQRGDLTLRAFDPAEGSDERQYCSPGFNLPVGQFAKTVYLEYDAYHNSLDTKEFMGIDSLLSSLEEIERFLRELDACGRYENLSPYGEPQLGRRGLYPNINSENTRNASSDTVNDGKILLNCILYLLNYSDKKHDVLDIAGLSGYSVAQLDAAARKLEAAGLLRFLGSKGMSDI